MTTTQPAGLRMSVNSLREAFWSNQMLTLGITRILEQESLEVTIWGSSDGEKWEVAAAGEVSLLSSIVAFIPFC